MKYLQQQQRELPGEPIPESACSVFAQNEVYRKYVQNLDVVVSLYNKCVYWWLGEGLVEVCTCGRGRGWLRCALVVGEGLVEVCICVWRRAG